MAVEGVTKFTADHALAPWRPGAHAEGLAQLAAWRSIMAGVGGIGEDPKRYDGAGYGNISLRTPPWGAPRGRRSFLISGTQTGGLPCVGPDDFCRVTTYDVGRNHVAAEGPVAPSSESLTHGAVYDVSPTLRAVVHVHCPGIFAVADRLGIPATGPGIDYGTVAMAREVSRLWRSTTFPDKRCFIMAAHLDGVVSVGRTLDEAASTMLVTLAKALALDAPYGQTCAPRAFLR